MKDAAFEIGGKFVGSGLRPMIVAEMSGNHGGRFEEALKIVRAAAASGADAIKLQTYTPETLTIDSKRPEFFIHDAGSLWHGRRLWDLYAEAHTPWEWHKPIFEVARAAGLACISTVFDFSSLEFLLSLGADAIKIASFELVHLPLLEEAANSGKPIILSTGMATSKEIDEAVETLRVHGCQQFVLLKCTSAYPSKEDHAHIETMRDMRRRYSCEVGLSDHSLRPYAAFAATALGAAVVEKHLMLTRAEGGIDSAFSIEPSELHELVVGCEMVWRSRGEIRYGPLPVEETSLKERCSIYVIRPVKKGEKFTTNNVRIIRPANGLAPKHYHAVIGRTCARDLDGEVPMSWELLSRDGG